MATFKQLQQVIYTPVIQSASSNVNIYKDLYNIQYIIHIHIFIVPLAQMNDTLGKMLDAFKYSKLRKCLANATAFNVFISDIK